MPESTEGGAPAGEAEAQEKPSALRGGDGTFATAGAGTVRAKPKAEGAPEEKSKPAESEAPKPWKQKIRYRDNGKDAERDLDEHQAATLLQQSAGIGRQSREMAAERKMLAELRAKATAGDPGPLLKHFGIDPHAAYVKTVQTEAQRAALTPEELREQEFKDREAALAAKQQEFEESTYQAEVKRAAEALQPIFEAEFPKALEARGLPLRNPVIVDLASKALSEALSEGEMELEPYLIHAAVAQAHEEALEMSQSLLAPMSLPQLSKHLSLDARFADMVKEGKVDPAAWAELKAAFPNLVRLARAGDNLDYETKRRGPTNGTPSPAAIQKPPKGQHWIDADNL